MIPTEITVRDIEKTPAIEEKIHQKIEKLEQFYDRIESCKVVIDATQNSKHNGKLYNVFVECLVPKKKLIVNRNPNEDLYVAIRDAFSAMTKQMKDFRDRQHGDVKNHTEELHGIVDRLFSGYGFIATSDGEEFYFNESNVLHSNFNDINEGARVRFLEGELGETPQASHVILMSDQAHE